MPFSKEVQAIARQFQRFHETGDPRAQDSNGLKRAKAISPNYTHREPGEEDFPVEWVENPNPRSLKAALKKMEKALESSNEGAERNSQAGEGSSREGSSQVPQQNEDRDEESDQEFESPGTSPPVSPVASTSRASATPTLFWNDPESDDSSTTVTRSKGKSLWSSLAERSATGNGISREGFAPGSLQSALAIRNQSSSGTGEDTGNNVPPHPSAEEDSERSTVEGAQYNEPHPPSTESGAPEGEDANRSFGEGPSDISDKENRYAGRLRQDNQSDTEELPDEVFYDSDESEGRSHDETSIEMEDPDSKNGEYTRFRIEGKVPVRGSMIISAPSRNTNLKYKDRRRQYIVKCKDFDKRWGFLSQVDIGRREDLKDYTPEDLTNSIIGVATDIQRSQTAPQFPPLTYVQLRLRQRDLYFVRGLLVNFYNSPEELETAMNRARKRVGQTLPMKVKPRVIREILQEAGEEHLAVREETPEQIVQYRQRNKGENRRKPLKVARQADTGQMQADTVETVHGQMPETVRLDKLEAVIDLLTFNSSG